MELEHEIIDTDKMKTYLNSSQKTFKKEKLAYKKGTNDTRTEPSRSAVSSGVPTTPFVPPAANQEFKAAVELNNIIQKFEKLTREKRTGLKKDLPSSLAEELNECQDMFKKIELQGLINNHMSAVLSDDTIQEIRKVGFFTTIFF